MLTAIEEVSGALGTLNKGDAWSTDLRASVEVLDLIFAKFFKALELPNLMRKSDYHELAALVPRESIDEEVVEVLDMIVDVSKRAVSRLP